MPVIKCLKCYKMLVIKCSNERNEEEEQPRSEVELLQEVSRGGQADKQQREFADEGGGGFSPSCISPPYFLPVFPPVFPPCISPPFFMHF